jgi:hypothetical protein
LHSKDKALLEQIKSYFCAGRIYKQESESVQLRVESVKDLAKVLDHFDRYLLITQKRADYELFKQAVELLQNKKHLTMEGLRKIVGIKASMNKGLSEELKAAFPDTISVPRPLVKDQEIKDPNWLAGFTSGEGCYFVSFESSPSCKLKERVKLIFQLTQHSRDEQLMVNLANYLDCGNIFKKRDAFDFVVTKFLDIENQIIPFFQKYPIRGIKALDYADFVKAADIIKVKGHLTAEGLDQIRKIKAGMNKGRK